MEKKFFKIVDGNFMVMHNNVIPHIVRILTKYVVDFNEIVHQKSRLESHRARLGRGILNIKRLRTGLSRGPGGNTSY